MADDSDVLLRRVTYRLPAVKWWFGDKVIMDGAPDIEATVIEFNVVAADTYQVRVAWFANGQRFTDWCWPYGLRDA